MEDSGAAAQMESGPPPLLLEVGPLAGRQEKRWCVRGGNPQSHWV